MEGRGRREPGGGVGVAGVGEWSKGGGCKGVGGIAISFYKSTLYAQYLQSRDKR